MSNGATEGSNEGYELRFVTDKWTPRLWEAREYADNIFNYIAVKLFLNGKPLAKVPRDVGVRLCIVEQLDGGETNESFKAIEIPTPMKGTFYFQNVRMQRPGRFALVVSATNPSLSVKPCTHHFRVTDHAHACRERIEPTIRLFQFKDGTEVQEGWLGRYRGGFDGFLTREEFADYWRQNARHCKAVIPRHVRVPPQPGEALSERRTRQKRNDRMPLKREFPFEVVNGTGTFTIFSIAQLRRQLDRVAQVGIAATLAEGAGAGRGAERKVSEDGATLVPDPDDEYVRPRPRQRKGKKRRRPSSSAASKTGGRSAGLKAKRPARRRKPATKMSL